MIEFETWMWGLFFIAVLLLVLFFMESITIKEIKGDRKR